MTRNEIATITKAKAIGHCNAIRERLGDICVMVAELRNKRGWEVLSYKSWDECVQKEFGRTKVWANHLIAMDEVRKQIAPPAEVKGERNSSTPPPVVPDSHIQVLMPLPEDQRAAAYQDVIDEAGDKPVTAKDVKAKVKLYQADNEEPALDAAGAEDGKCPNCGGRGSVEKSAGFAGSRKYKCKDCGGTGKAKPDYGKCPNCAGTKWDEDEDGVSCSKCHHPHGESTGGPDEDRIQTQRQKSRKTAEALMRAFDDLQCLKARPGNAEATELCNLLAKMTLGHEETISLCKLLIVTAQGWK